VTHFPAMILALAIGLCAPLAAQEGPPVTVRATASGGSTYTYSVTNNTARRSIVSVTIGEDGHGGVCELQALPSGFTTDGGMSPASATTPPGWTADAFIDEESGNGCVEFVSRESDTSADIGPDATAMGFSVTAAVADGRYAGGHFTVIFHDATTWSGWIESGATGRR